MPGSRGEEARRLPSSCKAQDTPETRKYPAPKPTILKTRKSLSQCMVGYPGEASRDPNNNNNNKNPCLSTVPSCVGESSLCLEAEAVSQERSYKGPATLFQLLLQLADRHTISPLLARSTSLGSESKVSDMKKQGPGRTLHASAGGNNSSFSEAVLRATTAASAGGAGPPSRSACNCRGFLGPIL